MLRGGTAERAGLGIEDGLVRDATGGVVGVAPLAVIDVVASRRRGVLEQALQPREGLIALAEQMVAEPMGERQRPERPDGAGTALATLAVIGFINNWNDFLGPLIFLESRSNFTIALGLRYFQNVSGLGGEPMQHLLMAASVTFTIPCIVLFFVAQRYFVQGIALTGVKG